MNETDDTMVIWRHYDWRFDVPKSMIIAVGRNIILGMNYKDVFQYKPSRDEPLATGEPMEKLADEYR